MAAGRLSDVFSTPCSLLLLLLLIANVALVVYSHVGVSAYVLAEYSGVEETIYEISFLSSLKDCFDEGAYFLGVVVLICSGVWPYAKNVILFFCWFLSMESGTRAGILRWTIRLSRYSFMDTYFICFLLVGLKMEGTLELAVESEPSVWTFAIAALMDLAVGDWMRRQALNLHGKGAGNDSTGEPGQGSSGPSFVEKCLGFSVALIAIASWVPAMFLTFASIGYTSTYFGDDEFDFSVYTMVENLYSTSSDLVETTGGSRFLAIVLFGTAMVVPALVALAATVSLCFSPAAVLVEYLWAFSSLDVFCLASIVVFIEWDSLLEKVTDDLEDISSLLAVDFYGSFTTLGIILLLVAALSGKLLEYFVPKKRKQPPAEGEEGGAGVETKSTSYLNRGVNDKVPYQTVQ